MSACPFLLLKYESDPAHLKYFLHSQDKWRRVRRLIAEEKVLCMLHIPSLANTARGSSYEVHSRDAVGVSQAESM